ncbi:MAG TPA: RNB domain-containing ribonuclease [Candidatus Sulfotelmatobacter sp.]|nr:RNB domain-containing ribonuclease [Candidatus Sulfotelmatobacter sp.]
MNAASPSQLDLQATAKQIMIEHGFEPDFPPAVPAQVAQLRAHPPQLAAGAVRDLRQLLWSSIDNDTSRDLDQIEVAERLSNGDVKVMVGIADVDTFAPKQTAIDQHAARETTTVYAGVRNFPMIPEELSTGVTSLLENEDRLSVIVEFVVDAAGVVSGGELYRALVRNKAQLQYNSLGAWLEGKSVASAKIAASSDLQVQLKLQDEVAQRLKTQRFAHGALTLQSDELHPVVVDDQVVDVVKQEKNRATELIEDFMIAANGVGARYLENVSSLRRIVRTPERWDRIVQLAAAKGAKLPADPDSKALNDFLLQQKAADSGHFADLSLAVIKLIGPGEYVLERAGDTAPGHFGLAVRDYTHSTAPNRRFADLVTQRLVKAKLLGQKNPYTDDELTAVAANCTQKENAAKKVEREMTKRLAAITMQHRIGETFDAIVTGVTPNGTFVRVQQPRLEGLLAQGQKGLDVGDKLRAKLIRTDVQRGYIDFARA